MKIIIFVALLSFCISCQGLEIPEELNNYSNNAISHWISQTFINRLKAQQWQGLNDTGLSGPASYSNPNASVTVLPPFDDPLYLKTWEFVLDLTFSNLLRLKGDWSFCLPKLVGLSNLTDKMTIRMLPYGGLFLGWDFILPVLSIEAPYQISLDLNTTIVPGGVLAGEGQFLTRIGDGNINNSFFKLEANLSIFDGIFSLDELLIDLEYQNLTASAENLTINGDPINLDSLTLGIKTLLGFIWNDNSKEVLTEQIRCMIDSAISNCTVADFIGSNFDCFDITKNSTCFKNVTDTGVDIRRQDEINDIGFCKEYTKPPTATTIRTTARTSTETSGTVVLNIRKDVLFLIVVTLYGQLF